MFTFVTQLRQPGNRFVAGIALLAALGGFLFGFDTGVVGSAEPFFSKTLHIGSFGESWVVGSLLLGAIAGAVCSGWLADAISRKWTKFVSGCIFAVAALASAFSPNVEILCIARFVLGLAVGTASFVAPMYISEHSPQALRGGMTAFNQVMITLGIFAAYLSDFGFSHVSGTWRWMFGIEALPGVALAVAMVLVPHTPRWLVEKGRTTTAKEVLRQTRATDNVDEELDAIKDVHGKERHTRVRELVGPKLRPLLVVGIGLAILQQLVGINAVIYFGSTIMEFLGHKANAAVYDAISLGAANFAGALVAAMILDWVGRRKMLIAGSAGMVLSLGALGWYFSMGTSFEHGDAWVGLACVLAYLVFFEISLGPIFWLMISELYPLRIRPKAMALATMFNWTFNFLVSYFFLTMTQDIGRDGTFWFFGAFAVAATVFSVWKVPETKDRSLEQIERDVSGDAQAAGAEAA